MSSLIAAIVAVLSFWVAARKADLAGERYRDLTRVVAALVGALGAIAAVGSVGSRFLVVVPAGNVGVRELFGSVTDRPLSSGVHLVHPFADVVEFSTRLQDIKETITATTKEGLTVEIDVSLQYRLEGDRADEVYRNIGTDPREIIISRFRSTVRETTASYDASAIYGEKRQEVSQELRGKLQTQLTPLGFVIEEALLRNVTLPENLQESIEDKLAAEQESQRAEFELEKARQEAERQRIEARGRADAQRLLSEGLSDSVLQLRAIEATERLARSDNAKVIIIGGGENRLPLILQPAE